MSENEIKKTEELNDSEMQKVVGGYYSGTYDQDPQGWINQDNWNGRNKKRVDPPKWKCPKCFSWDVTNYDPGWLSQMRVHCKNCGFWGCRDGSPDF